jgi:hypothetical protein
MFTDRGRAGFSGIMVVMMVLLAVQLLTGVRAFPL